MPSGLCVQARVHRGAAMRAAPGTGREMPTVPVKGFRSTQISSVGAGAADPPCDGERWDGLMSAPRDPWWQSRESSVRQV